MHNIALIENSDGRLLSEVREQEIGQDSLSVWGANFIRVSSVSVSRCPESSQPRTNKCHAMPIQRVCGGGDSDARLNIMTMSSSLRAAVTEPTSPQARTLLKVLSLGAGAFLVFAGVWGGCMTPIMGGGFVYFVGAVYAVLFGLIVLTVEIKDKTKLITAFYQWIDKYLKFLTLQRGKGAFYLGVGLLVCFMSPSGNSQPALGVNNVAAIILAVVGFLHTCATWP